MAGGPWCQFTAFCVVLVGMLLAFVFGLVEDYGFREHFIEPIFMDGTFREADTTLLASFAL